VSESSASIVSPTNPSIPALCEAFNGSAAMVLLMGAVGMTLTLRRLAATPRGWERICVAWMATTSAR